MESVYIETSVVSYLVARPSRDLKAALRQNITKEWWAEQRGRFACVISQEVIAEALNGDSEMAARRIAALQGLPLIAGSLESTKLAVDLLRRGLFPANAGTDASRLAIATVAAVDYVLTWNYRHLATAQILRHLETFISERGLRLPRVCTPEEFMGK